MGKGKDKRRRKERRLERRSRKLHINHAVLKQRVLEEPEDAFVLAGSDFRDLSDRDDVDDQQR